MKRKNIVFKALTCGLASLAFTACTDTWESHYQSKPELNATETLWDLIEADPELSQFEAYIKATGYEEVLKQNRFYTIWAPVDGSEFYTTHPLEGVSDSMINVYKLEFVENHIADYNHTASGAMSDNNKVKMLNGKYNVFKGNTGGYIFKNAEVTEANIAAKNGLLHKTATNAVFTPNVWEQLAKEPLIASLNGYLKSFDEIRFDEYSSVQGPTVDGKVTYLDSVFEEHNDWYSRIGRLNREDSSYIMFAPTDKAWAETYERVKTFFVYDEQVVGRDSLQDEMAKDYMCINLAFSKTIQESPDDSLTVYSRSNLGNGSFRYKKEVFKNEEYERLFSNLIETKELSNGTLHIVDSFNYRNYWHDTLRVQGESLYGEAEGLTDAKEYENAIKSYLSISKDSVDRYYQTQNGTVGVYKSSLSNNNPRLRFNISNVLSASYRIKAVFVPGNWVDERDTTFLPCKIKASLAYRDLNGKKKTQSFGNYQINTRVVDTITFVVKNNEIFNFPANELGLDASQIMTQLTIEGAVGPREKNFDRTLRIDQVFLEPVTEE